MNGFIVGSGFYEYKGLKCVSVKTEWGVAELLRGKISGKDTVIICRHGKNHESLPHHINYRANIAALKEVGCTAVISCSVVGVINPNLQLGKPYIIRDLHFPENRLPDGESCTFFTKPGAHERGHLIAGSLFHGDLKQMCSDLLDADQATYAYSIGPRFNTKMEIVALQSAGCDLVSQTCGPEAVLTNELEIPYAMVTFAIDYANSVREEPTPVEELNHHLAKSQEVFKKLIEDYNKQGEPDLRFENFVYRFS